MSADMNDQKMFDLEQMESIRRAVVTAPPPAREMTKKELIQALVPDLNSARLNGHSAQSLCDVLGGLGVKTTPREITRLMRASATSSARSKARKEPKSEAML
jgi:hypothetical protein